MLRTVCAVLGVQMIIAVAAIVVLREPDVRPFFSDGPYRIQTTLNGAVVDQRVEHMTRASSAVSSTLLGDVEALIAAKTGAVIAFRGGPDDPRASRRLRRVASVGDERRFACEDGPGSLVLRYADGGRASVQVHDLPSMAGLAIDIRPADAVTRIAGPVDFSITPSGRIMRPWRVGKYRINFLPSVVIDEHQWVEGEVMVVGGSPRGLMQDSDFALVDGLPRERVDALLGSAVDAAVQRGDVLETVRHAVQAHLSCLPGHAADLSPMEALAAGVGDCTEFARLGAAILGSLGYRTRFNVGFFFDANVNRFIPHAWLDVLDARAGVPLHWDPLNHAAPRSYYLRLPAQRGGLLSAPFAQLFAMYEAPSIQVMYGTP